MKVSAIVAVAVGLTASLVSAQLESIPQCALGCAVSSLGSTGCPTTDIACICSATAFLQALTPCVQAACTPQEFAATIEAAQQLCAAAGVTLSIPGPTSTPAEETPTETPTEAPTTMLTVTPPSNSTIVTPPVPTPSSNATATSTEAPSPTEGETEAPSATASQTGAASRNAIALGGLGAAVVAFAAALL